MYVGMYVVYVCMYVVYVCSVCSVCSVCMYVCTFLCIDYVMGVGISKGASTLSPLTHPAQCSRRDLK
jgi:hypothetical protein